MRRTALEARERLDDAERADRLQQLLPHLERLVHRLQPRVLGFCWPYRGEADLRDWIGSWLAADERRLAALPAVLEKHTALRFLRWQPGMEMVPDCHGIPRPQALEEVQPEVMLVPLNAFDAAGYRLGYGGGYFDRTLAQRSMVAVGVGFELGRVDDTLPAPHDRPMDWIVTDAGVVVAKG